MTKKMSYLIKLNAFTSTFLSKRTPPATTSSLKEATVAFMSLAVLFFSSNNTFFALFLLCLCQPFI